MPDVEEKKRTLFDISEDCLALNDLLEEIGGDLSDPKIETAIAELLAEIDANEQQKVESYCWLIRKLEADAAVAKEESERMAQKARVRLNRVVFLKARLKIHMEQTGKKKIETPRFTVAIQNNGGQRPVDFKDESLIPAKFFVTVPEHQELDREKVRRALDAGEEVPGVVMSDGGTSLRIR